MGDQPSVQALLLNFPHLGHWGFFVLAQVLVLHLLVLVSFGMALLHWPQGVLC